jgi:DNA-binding response OmpR family regulator
MATILVVDDDPDVLAITRLTFECSGHRVFATTDPSEALKLVEKAPPDAVVLDVMMPGLTGWELLAALRVRPETRWVPILMLSALDDTGHRIRGLRTGADDYLGKPFEPNELAARVERLIARHGPEVGGLEGQLAVCPLSEVAQTLEDNARTGVILIRAGNEAGRIELRDGRVVGARFEELRDLEAVRAMLDLTEGFFRFQTAEVEAAPPPPPPGEGYSIRNLAIEAAWLRDELRRQIAKLPPPDRPLLVTGKSFRMPASGPDLPVGWVLEYLRAFPAATLEQLIGARTAAPSRVRLTVAWLLQAGALRVEEPQPPLPADLDRACRDLLQEAVFRGHDLAGVRLLHLVQPGAWEALGMLLGQLPETLLAAGGAAAREELLAAGTGSLEVAHEAGTLRLDFHRLGGGGKLSFEVPEDAMGVVLVLDAETTAADFESLAEALEAASPLGAQRLIVAATDEVRERAQTLAGDRLSWRVAPKGIARLAQLLRELVAADAADAATAETVSRPDPGNGSPAPGG